MEEADIPEETVKAVAKRLKHYMEVERLEEGFDLTTSNSDTGYFHSGRGLGGSYHYNRLQDRHLHHAIENPKVKARLESMGSAEKGMFTELEKTAKKTCKPKLISSETSQFKKQKYYKTSENANLTEAAAKVLLQDQYIRTNPRQQESDEETNHTYSEYSSSSRSTARKHTSSSLNSSGRRTSSRSSSSDMRHHQVKTPEPTSSQSSMADTKESESVDDPPQTEPLQDVSPRDQPSTTPPAVTSNIAVTMAPTTTSQTTPTATAAEAPATTNATQFPYNPQQPGFPIFYTISPNEPPPGATILTPVFQPGTAYPQIALTSPPQVTSPLQEDVEVQPDTGESVEQSAVINAPDTAQEAKIIVKENKSVNTSTISDATTQTPVHVQTQTERSAVFKMSERERKNKNREEKLAGAESRQGTTDSKLIQTSPQPSPLAVHQTSRPTSAMSSRSSRSKDASGKKKKESLLSTKSYSASNPNVTVKSMETQLHSDSASSVSSRRSDSAVHKKRKVKETSKKGVIKSPSHRASSPSMNSESAKQSGSTKSLHEKGPESKEVATSESAPSEAKVAGSTSSHTAIVKDEVDGISASASEAQQNDNQIELAPAIQTSATSLSGDILKSGVEEATKDEEELAESVSSESKKNTENIVTIDSGQDEAKASSPSIGIKEEHSSNGEAQGENDIDYTSNNGEAQQSNSSPSAVSLKKDKESSGLVSNDAPESPSDATMNGSTSIDKPEVSDKFDSSSNLDKSEAASSSDITTKNAVEAEKEALLKDEVAANVDSEANCEVDKSTVSDKIDECQAEVKQPDLNTAAENGTEIISDNKVADSEPSKDDASPTSDKIPPTETGAGASSDAPTQGEMDQASESAAKDEPSEQVATKADDDEVTATKDEEQVVAFQESESKVQENSTTHIQDDMDQTSEAAAMDQPSEQAVIEADDDKNADTEDKEKTGESQEPENTIHENSSESQNAASTTQPSTEAEETLQAQGETIAENQASSSGSLSQIKSANVQEGSSTDSQGDKPPETNKSGDMVEESSNDNQEEEKPAEDHSLKESDKSVLEQPLAVEDQQEDRELCAVNQSPESQNGASANDQSTKDPSSGNKSAAKIESQASQESLNLSSQDPNQEFGAEVSSNVIKDETEVNSSIVKPPQAQGSEALDDGLPSTSEETSAEKTAETSAEKKAESSAEKPEESRAEKPAETQGADIPQDQALEQQHDKADMKEVQDNSSTQPPASNTTEPESQPSHPQQKEQPANSEHQAHSPEQSAQESISEEISSSSQDEASNTGNNELKPPPNNAVPSSDLDSSITEVEESDTLTPVTDDLDTSRETALDMETETNAQTQKSQLSEPAETLGKTLGDSSAAEASGAQGEISGGKELAEGDTKDVDQLSEISSIITATSTEGSKESEAQ